MSQAPNFVVAADRLEHAKTAILEAIRELGRSRGDLPCWSSVAERLGIIAGHLREGRVLRAQREPIIGREVAGQALAGGPASEKKLEGLRLAREALKKKREAAAVARRLTKR